MTVVLLAGLAGCATQPSAPTAPTPAAPDRLLLTPARFSDLPGWRMDRIDQALPAMIASCGRLTRAGVADTAPVGPAGETGPLAGTVADWRPVCARLAQVPANNPDAARAAFEALFTPMKAASANTGDGLFTGYYEAELTGSLKPGGKYQTPLYGRPADLVTVDLSEFRADWKGQTIAGRVESGTNGTQRLRPYPDRAAIVAGGIKGKAPELVWVDDPIEAFFLQVQGSGRVKLPDGKVIRLGYAAQNGRTYVTIGRVMVDEGLIPRPANLQSIRGWLETHPREAEGIMSRNPSYVFFRSIDNVDPSLGPLGAEGVPLTPGRSLAVDPSLIALGLPLYLDVDEPREPGGRLNRLVIAQDTGGAIKGAVRGDVFWGFGNAARDRAGTMQQRGIYYVLLPNAVAARRVPSS